MNDTSILKLITGPLKPAFAILLIFVGLYSILINAKHETKSNFTRSATLARIGGWYYIIVGAGLLIILHLTS